MIYTYDIPSTGAYCCLATSENNYRDLLHSQQDKQLLTLLLSGGQDQAITIDGVRYDLPAHTVVSLVYQQYFALDRPEEVVLWRFNRDFYCVIDHDKEVSCAGFIFYGHQRPMMIQLDDSGKRKLRLLTEVFVDEFSYRDNIQGEMLVMLLKRLIILVTRMGKEQHLAKVTDHGEVDLIRQFNLAVEEHFRDKHQVQDYADVVFRSPKTLSNVFAKAGGRSPRAVIHDRIVLEAKRLLHYTDKTAKEIGYELGFDDPTAFSRLFKKVTGHSPMAFKKILHQATG